MLFDTPVFFAFLLVVVVSYWRFGWRRQNIILLSTSNSETKGHSGRLALATILLLALIAALLVGMEVFARVIVERHSKVQRMVNEEYQAAIQLRKTPVRKRNIFCRKLARWPAGAELYTRKLVLTLTPRMNTWGYQ